MTSRLLLTLLALLTGFSVNGNAVHARVAPAQQAEIGAVAPISQVRIARLAAALPTVMEPASASFDSFSSDFRPAGRVQVPAGVLIGIDRARE